MPFPEVRRVIYGRNPLTQVVCQLRFPPILKIDAEIPGEFQDRVRAEFPDYSEKSELRVEFPGGQEQIPSEIISHMLQSPGKKNYQFSSDDGRWRVNLTRTFVALTTNDYERWELFKDRLATPLNALTDIYSPAYFSRIGLRYVDVIKRSRLALEDVAWGELLQPFLLGLLGVPELNDHVKNFENSWEVTLSDDVSMVRLITRFVIDDDGETSFMIDSDFYKTEKTDIDSAPDHLDYLNTRAGRLIRWCITDRLHQAMEPTEI